MTQLRFLATSLHLLLLLELVVCYPHLWHEFKQRQIEHRQARDTYDYIVVGGGQSGLVVANRLSEDPEATVLIVEYGYFDNSRAVLEPRITMRQQNMFNVTSVPQPGLGNRRQRVPSACVVGGFVSLTSVSGSAVNGMMLNRGAADDYDNWEKLNNPGWGWNDLLPYFVKSTTFEAPSPQLQADFNITWNASSYGTDGPIHVSFASYQWPSIKVQYQALTEAGAVPQLCGADGNAYGVFWYTNAIDNTTVTRSYARTGYYDPVKDRANLEILTGWRVNEIELDEDKHATGIRMQPRGTPDGQDVTVIRANKEIILTAGSLHSPQILQRSGIGPKWLLDQANISVLVDLPGVGSNLQDHPSGRVSYTYMKNIEPNPQTRRQNATFEAWVQEQWREHRTGPMAITTGNTVGLLPLKLISPTRWRSIVVGYEAQRAVLADSMSRDDNAIVEFPIQAHSSYSLIMTKAVSRGTVLLNTDNVYAEPIVDYGTFINPVDVAIQVENMRWTREYHKTESMQRYFAPEEQFPGANVTSDEELTRVARMMTSSTTAHISGTCAMMPREYGGVVDAELKVHGVSGLSVADSSVQPLIPGAHLCATVYAVAEKAADLIKARHQKAVEER
ncbi:Oxygen-dependent choline dehydrogenase [Madurella mycetomatis]|uniref:Oxygen-dependent choline dehydrogenase n=1 Tax=Madurella mycetomatis TaxID=100816 RepID=A0A175VX14_9PEZI|nr:Oxygen-dependent choline dehydrogenase [Madurella mycetomatis]